MFHLLCDAQRCLVALAADPRTGDPTLSTEALGALTGRSPVSSSPYTGGAYYAGSSAPTAPYPAA